MSDTPVRLPDPGPAARDPDRLSALHRVRILDTPTEASFDRLTRLATRTLDAPISLVSLVDEDRQFFKSCIGLPQPWADDRQTPLSHSLCQYAVATDSPLVIDDARQDPELATNGAVTELGVIAYAGVPIRTRMGEVLGSFCVIDDRSRSWSEEDLEVIAELAGLAGELIELRLEAIVGADRQAIVGQLVAAQESERARIAAEVHDDSLQVITAVSIRLQLLQRRVDDDLAGELEALNEAVQAGTDRLRSLLFELRPSVLDNSELGVALAAYLDQTVEGGGPSWAVEAGGLEREPPAETGLVLFRIAQEALGNSLAHAAARLVLVVLRSEGTGVEMTVSDDGCGFDPLGPSSPGHLGLTIIRERADLVGGTVRIASSRLGTTVRVWLPVRGG